MDTAVYVHFPWCERKCPYCDFATRATEPPAIPERAYTDAVLHELAMRRPALSARRLLSVYFGGGTPSLWSPRQLGRVLAGVRDAFEDEVPELEVTVECNPVSFDRDKAAALRDVGVDRVSLGVQSLDDTQLRYLGRRHDAHRALRAVDDAMAELPRVSADLMFGLPGQPPSEVCDHLERLLARGIEHVSAYALTIEPATRFGELHRQGRLPVASDDAYADTYLTVQDTLTRAGLEHYEVSNYARRGAEARHNQHYWRAGAYVGLGAAAVGCLDTHGGRARRWRNHPDPSRYRARADHEEVEIEQERLDPQDRIREALMLGLRTREGVDLRAVERETGVDPRQGRHEALDQRIAAGDVVLDGHYARVPTDRWLRLDGIITDLF